jgi:hypothetical protein
MAMYTKCPKCGHDVQVNDMPEAVGKFSQGQSRVSGTPVECAECRTWLVPKALFLKAS